MGDCDDDDILYMMRDIFALSFMQTVVKYNGVRNVKCSAFETPIKILKIWVQRIITWSEQGSAEEGTIFHFTLLLALVKPVNLGYLTIELTSNQH